MITLIQELDNIFIRTERDIRTVINRINSGKYERFIKQDGEKLKWESVKKIDYRFLSGNQPTLSLEKFYSNQVRTAKLKNEIETEFIQNNSAYFIYLNEKMHQHFRFIKEFSSIYLSEYFKNTEEAKRLIYLLRHRPYTLSKEEIQEGTPHPPYQSFSKEEIIKAIHFSFVELFLKFEDLINKSSPNYSKLLTLHGTDVTVIQIPDHIHLNYGDRNFKVIETIFDAVKETFINDDFAAFDAHFKPSTVPLKKIKWKGSLSLLCTIFNGVTLKDKYTTNVPRLKVSNTNIHKMIVDHFCNKSGNEFNEEVVRITTARLTTKNVGGIKLILPALQSIAKSYERL